MAKVTSPRSKVGVGGTLALIALVALFLAGVCAVSPFAYLAYERHRIDRFCGSVVKGEPIQEVSQRARAQEFGVFDEAQLLRRGSSAERGELIVSTNFLLAHLLCSVKYDGQHVESASRSELW